MLFWKGRRPGALVGAMALAVIAGCTASTPPAQPPTATSTSTGSPTRSDTPHPTSPPTATPTPTWSTDQAAAIKAVDGFDAASTKVAADPAAFTKGQMTKVFEKSVGGDVLSRNVESFMRMRDKGYREVGTRSEVFTLATTGVDDGKGAEVHVTRCWDQRELAVVDADGRSVGEKDGDEGYLYPDYNLRQYTVLRPAGDASFRVFGVQTINGSCP